MNQTSLGFRPCTVGGWMLCWAFAALLSVFSPAAFATDSFAAVHGLWVWKGLTVLETPRAAEALRDFCRSQGINEIYLSVSEKRDAADDRRLADLISLLHRSDIRVEALLSSTDADEPGKHREKLIEHVRAIVEFNRSHPQDRFDGIHLDIEPQQRPENKGTGNLGFVSGMVDAYREVLAVAEPARMTVNADIQNKLLKGDLAERKMLLSALPRLTLMLYELSSRSDADSPQQKAEKLRKAAEKYFNTAYEGLSDPNLAKMSIALRTPDYGDLLPAMFKTLDEANQTNPHYLGWARHSYNDHLKATP